MLSRCADQRVLSSFATCTKAMSRTASQEGVRGARRESIDRAPRRGRCTTNPTLSLAIMYFQVQSSLRRTFAVHASQEVRHEPIHLSRRFLLGPVPNARQQDPVPEIRNALPQVVNVGPRELDHGVVCSSDIQRRLQQQWLQDERNFIYVLNGEGLWVVSKPADRQPDQIESSNNY
jgi:hypothetical protein